MQCASQRFLIVFRTIRSVNCSIRAVRSNKSLFKLLTPVCSTKGFLVFTAAIQSSIKELIKLHRKKQIQLELKGY